MSQFFNPRTKEIIRKRSVNSVCVEDEVIAMMRLKKGSKVEVLSKKEVSIGCWICAEVISGNGHTYSVKYGWFPMTNDEVERVPRKAIRPCPPPVEGVGNWVPGDLVEVFHNFSWKTARISKDMGENKFSVRVLGLSLELSVHRFNIRVRQSWQDGEWLIVGKGFGNCSVPVGKRQTDAKRKLGVRDDYFPVKKDIRAEKPHKVLTLKLKRGSSLGIHTSSAQKMRVIVKFGGHKRILIGRQSPLSEKVDAFISPQKTLGENNMRSSFYTGNTGCSIIDPDRGNSNFLTGTSMPTNSDRCVSSVGSCSSNGNSLHNLPFNSVRRSSKDIESYCSDAESFCGRENEEEGRSLPTNEELGAEIHRSELRTYHRTMEALYASGPLSWEQELEMTKLRRTLHISVDEHLMELRHLTASDIRHTIS